MFVRKLILLKGTSPLHKIRYLTGQESTQSFLLWTLRANLSSVNSEEPFDVRHYLSKTLLLQFVLKNAYLTKSTGLASEWFLYTIYLSLVGLFPTMRLFRLILCVENKENLTYIASTTTKKTRIPAQPPQLFHAATNTSQTHTTKTQWKVSFNLPTLTIPSAPGTRARSSGLFPQATLGTESRK